MKKEISYYERLVMIDDIKKIFEKELTARLDLVRVPCPLFVKTITGLQDELAGVEKSVSFIKDGEKFEIVHSLAKWKRDVLGKYSFPTYKGILTRMKAIRKDEIVDDIHSLYVEQWDWEKVIKKEDRTIDYLKETVKSIYKSIRETAIKMRKIYPFLEISLPKTIYFITCSELLEKYPDKDAKTREELITKEKGAVFIIGIGDKLKDGLPHDKRSPDYDDWKLDGDLLVYDKKYGRSMELTSMGIRVDKDSLLEQLKKSHTEDRLKKPYHQKIIHDELPYTIGGGIGETRLVMLILGIKHIAEAQASSWQDITYQETTKLSIL